MPNLTANSAMSANQPMDYTSWLNSNYDGGIWSPDASGGYGLGGKVLNFFSGVGDRNKDAYQLYLDMNNRQYELDKITDARKWEEYMQSTQYQRMVKDMEAAGLNPGVVLSGGAGVAPSVGSPTGRGNSSAAATFRRSDDAGETGSILGRLASTAMMAMAMVATKGMAAAGKAANMAAKSAKLKSDLAEALAPILKK